MASLSSQPSSFPARTAWGRRGSCSGVAEHSPVPQMRKDASAVFAQHGCACPAPSASSPLDATGSHDQFSTYVRQIAEGQQSVKGSSVHNQIRGAARARLAGSLAGGQGQEGDDGRLAQCGKSRRQRKGSDWMKNPFADEVRMLEAINQRGRRESCSHQCKEARDCSRVQGRFCNSGSGMPKPATQKAATSSRSGSAEDASNAARPASAGAHTGAPASRDDRLAASSTDATLALLLTVSRRCSRARRARW